MTGPSARGRPSPTTRRRAEPTPRRAEPVPPAGRFLLAGIDAVLPRLTAPAPASTPPPRLVDDLRAALARTAACGETCQVTQAADGVRLATSLLLAGATDEARQALRDARSVLVDPRGR
ncbi:hypothetical protein [Actinophytocola sp. NPDC049390]|uniref:hypothetical protein n=1 Tax=Actinophytocola sp. NPDC049390 TaxID=3363894 RepID=UPI0037A19E2E